MENVIIVALASLSSLAIVSTGAFIRTLLENSSYKRREK